MCVLLAADKSGPGTSVSVSHLRLFDIVSNFVVLVYYCGRRHEEAGSWEENRALLFREGIPVEDQHYCRH